MCAQRFQTQVGIWACWPQRLRDYLPGRACQWVCLASCSADLGPVQQPLITSGKGPGGKVLGMIVQQLISLGIFTVLAILFGWYATMCGGVTKVGLHYGGPQ